MYLRPINGGEGFMRDEPSSQASKVFPNHRGRHPYVELCRLLCKLTMLATNFVLAYYSSAHCQESKVLDSPMPPPELN